MLMNRRRRGFTLIEFMIAITISLVILAALTGAFVKSSRSRDEMDRANQQIENGRYAIQVLTDDLEMAGFWGQYDIVLGQPATPSALPDPCATSLATLRSSMPLHVQGYDGGATLTCLSDVKAGTDILVVRRAANCVRGTTNCAAVAGAPYFQASTCSSGAELLSTSATDYYRLDTNIANLDRHTRLCTDLADMRQYIVHIYFIANNDQSGDGVPTLKRAVLGVTGGALAFSIEPVAEGVEAMELEYGVDTDALGAAGYGAPNAFAADPSSYAAAGLNCPTTPADCMENWRNTMAVKLNLLVRNPSPSLNYSDTKTYTLGRKADDTANTFGPYGDAYKRHAYFTSVRLNNPARRRDS